MLLLGCQTMSAGCGVDQFDLLEAADFFDRTMNIDCLESILKIESCPRCGPFIPNTLSFFRGIATMYQKFKTPHVGQLCIIVKILIIVIDQGNKAI